MGIDVQVRVFLTGHVQRGPVHLQVFLGTLDLLREQPAKLPGAFGGRFCCHQITKLSSNSSRSGRPSMAQTISRA